jgi:CHC2-type zinc finger protein
MSGYDIRKAWRVVFGADPIDGRKSGPSQHRVLCPFHEEHEPSCDVSLSKNAFLCRSCGAKGGVLDVPICAGYVRSQAEAAKWLERVGAL